MANSKISQEKRVKLTKKNMDEYPVLYVVFANLVGLHDKVYKVKNKSKLHEELSSEIWWDASGNFEVSFGEYLGLNVSSNSHILKYITPDEKEAKKILNFGQALFEHLKNRI